MTTYPIIEVPVDSPVAAEPMGTKRKFWYDAEDQRWLFKFVRVNNGISTGEDWSEKIACELARVLGISAAQVDLACCQNQRGTRVRSFRQWVWPPNGESRIESELVHGNELLLERFEDYPREASYRVSEHTVARVFKVLEEKHVWSQLQFDPNAKMHFGTRKVGGSDEFVGFLLLDAWICNTDRHHENWAVLDPMKAIDVESGPLILAPSFDHASSLGRNISDDEFRERLETNDRNRTVQAYVEKSRSALYVEVGDTKPLSPIDAFRRASELRPDAAMYWLSRLTSIRPGVWEDILHRIPESIMSDVARQFVSVLLRTTYDRLCALVEERK